MDKNAKRRTVKSIMDGKTWRRLLLGILSGTIILVTMFGLVVNMRLTSISASITTLDVRDQIGDVPETPLTPIDVTPVTPTVSPSPSPSIIPSPSLLPIPTGPWAPIDILLLGSDSREGLTSQRYGSASKITGTRSDTAILLHLSGDRTWALGVSIPRDTIINLPVCTKNGRQVGGGSGRFNEAIGIGGPTCTLKAVREMTGVDVKNFMMVNFDGFKQIVDTVGGVDICLKNPVNDPYSGLKLAKGRHTVSGETALAYVRARHNIGDGSDISRMGRQQEFLKSLGRKILSAGTLLNPLELDAILSSLAENLTTDKQLGDAGNLKELALSLTGIQSKNITLETMPWGANPDGATVHMNKTQASVLWDLMRTDTQPPKTPGSGRQKPACT